MATWSWRVRLQNGVVNTFSLVRLHVLDAEGPVEHLIDLAVPVIDGMPLFTYIDGDLVPGLAFDDVAPPSRHWLGEPYDVVFERAAVLDGTCGVAGCCGVSARIDTGIDSVTWSDFSVGPNSALDLGPFVFDRAAYEATLAGCGDLAPVRWRFARAGTVGDPDDHGASLGERLRGAAACAVSWPADAWHRRKFRRRYPDALVSRRFGRNRGWFMYSPGSDDDPARHHTE